MKRLLGIPAMLAILLGLGVAWACGFGERAPEGYENVSAEHVFQHWQQGEKSNIPFVIIDVRTPEEYAEGHIKGAVLIPVQELEQRMAEVPRDRQVYVYCRSGRRSAKAAAMLAKHGFDRVENMVGGIEAWKAAGYPVVEGEEQ